MHKASMCIASLYRRGRDVKTPTSRSPVSKHDAEAADVAKAATLKAIRTAFVVRPNVKARLGTTLLGYG